MADAKSRREAGKPPPRSRPPVDRDDDDQPPRPAAVHPATRFPSDADDDFDDFDEEVNTRYEEIKRGGTHISELQHMTMPELLKTAKQEGLAENTGLKKQDLIFKILKERV